MKRSYFIDYSSKSKVPATKEDREGLVKEMKAVDKVIDATMSDDGLVITIEAEKEEDYTPIMDTIVNVFRRWDDTSEVEFKFDLNKEYL
ncbi:MAG: hypothetical protein ACOX78_08155 [Lachnospiraceae bacterium]|jgi:predicted P-loop ATPase